MEWLGGLLKSIIVVILLATFVDILLPTQSMQRYVKTVMSLFILLMLLQPLFSIVQKNASIDQLLADAMNSMTSRSGSLLASGPVQGGTQQMASLGTIQQQAEDLKNRQEEQSQRIMEQQIEDLMKKSIERTTGEVTVQSIKVETGKDSSGQLQIMSVSVNAVPADKEAAQRQASSAGTSKEPVKPVQIEPVKPVTIQIGPGSPAAASDTPASSDGSEDYEQQRTKIRMALNKEWQVPLDRIAVEVAANKTKS
ncbi:Stage III sporulation protein AF (Spore_III_AF) [Paenibacillus konkukensis]|uniref:Stage III sporulation protein AF (Spore_III_AF) n=1 Tax=Paenibacillus konkukensis TaxID=2020716 RepID=A0ABY4RKD4_9BACL|nr:stage III sporulation protein AF [Paenibacillus konkukensis]UQZ82069.1 Stage III sporulation protein AF (Spore_III_AF) [Paenibacillus konkukensis]